MSGKYGYISLFSALYDASAKLNLSLAASF